jgi:hypothetical protein
LGWGSADAVEDRLAVGWGGGLGWVRTLGDLRNSDLVEPDPKDLAGQSRGGLFLGEGNHPQVAVDIVSDFQNLHAGGTLLVEQNSTRKKLNIIHHFPSKDGNGAPNPFKI